MAIWGLMKLYYKAAFESSFTYPGATDRVPTTCQAAWQAWVYKVGSALKKSQMHLKPPEKFWQPLPSSLGYPATVSNCLEVSIFLSLQLHGLQHGRQLCLWKSPGKNAGVDYHFLFQGIFLSPGIKPAFPASPVLLVDSLLLNKEAHILGKPIFCPCLFIYSNLSSVKYALQIKFCP